MRRYDHKIPGQWNSNSVCPQNLGKCQIVIKAICSEPLVISSMRPALDSGVMRSLQSFLRRLRVFGDLRRLGRFPIGLERTDVAARDQLDVIADNLFASSFILVASRTCPDSRSRRPALVSRRSHRQSDLRRCCLSPPGTFGATAASARSFPAHSGNLSKAHPSRGYQLFSYSRIIPRHPCLSEFFGNSTIEVPPCAAV